MKELGPDFYNITDLLTEEELLIQQTAHDFVQTEFMPLINQHYENATFPMDLVPKLGELGFMGSALPEESGGAGVSNVAYGLILHELERGDSETSLDDMIGNIDTMKTIDSNSKEITLFIPLQLFFCRFTGLSLPLISLNHQDVTIKVEFREGQECINLSGTGAACTRASAPPATGNPAPPSRARPQSPPPRCTSTPGR